MKTALCTTLALVVAGSTAFAQPAPAPDPAAAALQQARSFIAASRCPSATARPAAPPTAMRDNTVREATYHRILIDGCGQQTQRNYLAIILLDGTRRINELLPGSTVTDPVLQRDAMQAATASANATVRNCQQIVPRDSRFDGQDTEPTASRRTRPWAEIWLMDACGTMLTVPMRFTPTDRGTSFTAGAATRRAN